MSKSGVFTVGQLAERFHEPVWKVRRIVDGLGIAVPRAGNYRLVPECLLGELEKRLRREPVAQEAAQ